MGPGQSGLQVLAFESGGRIRDETPFPLAQKAGTDSYGLRSDIHSHSQFRLVAIALRSAITVLQRLVHVRRSIPKPHRRWRRSRAPLHELVPVHRLEPPPAVPLGARRASGPCWIELPKAQRQRKR